MTDIKNMTIDPTEFLAMYQKMQSLNPLTYERVCGIIDGVAMMSDIYESTIAHKDENVSNQNSNA